MRLFVLLIVLSASSALAADAPPPPPPPPPPSSDPAPTAAEPPPPAVVEPPTVQPKGTSNWAKPAAFIGFGVGGAVLLTSIIAAVIGAVEYPYSEPGNLYFGTGGALMLLPLALTAAAGPVVFAGGRSARWTKSITGSKPLRVIGWISYGVGLFIQLISTGVWEARIVGGIVGAGAMACFGFDALFSANEAEDVGSMASREKDDSLFQFKPTVSVLLPGLAGSRGGTGAVVGITGTF